MIAELVRYADLIGVTGREPFRSRPIHWLIDLDEAGKVIGFAATAAATAQAKGGAVVERRGKEFSMPANYLLGSPNQHNWRPDFLSGPAEELFLRGIDGLNSSSKKRRDFWKLVVEAKTSLPSNVTLKAIWRFLRTTQRLADLPLPASARENLDWFRKRQNAEGETIGFRVAGKPASQDAELRNWWEHSRFPAIHASETAHFTETGEDAFQQGTGQITTSSPCVFGNVPLVSFQNDPFRSFGLKSQTARLRLDTVEKAAAALNTLRQDDSTRLNLGDETAIFWATQDSRLVDCSFVSLLEAKDPMAVADYLNSVWGSMPRELDRAAFHVAILQEGTGRFSVRSWDTSFLGEVDSHLRRYFETIRLPYGTPVNIGVMARATIQKTKKGSKTKPSNLTYNALFNTAWRGMPLPTRLLELVITRQCLELAKGCADKKDRGDFEARLRARTALIKLFFQTNKETTMNEQTHETQNRPAYLCGRVLAVLDKIHNAAHGQSTASSPAARYYGSASSTPALVFPRLCKLARIHLATIEKDKKLGWLAPLLDDDLTKLIARFSQDASWPPTLSLEDQGRFAIGFYYERSLRGGRSPEVSDQTDENQPNQP